MATLKLSLIDSKIEELTKTIATLKTRNVEDPTDPTYISKSTRGTQLYARGREKRVLHLIKSLVAAAGEDVKLSTEDMDTFVLITTLADERVLTKYEFHEGDSIMELMEKYQNLSQKDMKQKLEKLGLALDFKSGKVVKA